MVIQITPQDIEHGRRCDPDCCPVGRALSRAGVHHLGVLGKTVMIPVDPELAVAFHLPQEVAEWIVGFDSAERVNPISFTLDWSLPATQTAHRELRERINGRSRQVACSSLETMSSYQ